jgi:hypothetical protein
VSKVQDVVRPLVVAVRVVLRGLSELLGELLRFRLKLGEVGVEVLGSGAHHIHANSGRRRRSGQTRDSEGSERGRRLVPALARLGRPALALQPLDVD